MKKMSRFQLLLYLFLILSFASVTIQKGKTYEDLSEVIKNSNTIVSENSNGDTAQQKHNNNQQQTQQPQAQVIVTPPTFSTQDIPNTKKVATTQVQTQAPVDQSKQTKHTENVDDPNSLTHAKFHTHGQKNTSADDYAKQIANESGKKKKGSSDYAKLPPTTTYTQTTDKDYQTYFLLAILVLLLTAILIIGAIFGAIYFCMRVMRANRERYFQFDDKFEEEQVPNTGIGALSKIDEELEEEFATTDEKKKISSKRDSSTTQPTPSDISQTANNKDFSHAIEKEI